MNCIRICMALLLLGISGAWASQETGAPEPAAAGPAFEASFAGQQTVDGSNSVAVTFSMAVDPAQDLDAHFSLTDGDGRAVAGAWILAQDPQTVYFTHVEPDTAYKIRVGQGLTSKTGKRLAEAVVFEVSTRPAEPMIAFSSRGFVLPAKLDRGLPVDSLNLDRADIDFFRIKPDRVWAFRKDFARNQHLYYYQSQDLKKVADLVFSGRWDLEVKKDLRTQVNIPISHIEALKTPGVYFAVIRGAGHYEYGYNTTWFTISDLGVHARVYKNAHEYYVQSLATAGPVAGARIEGYDRDGKQLFSLETDTQGVARAAGDHKGLSLVMASQGDHLSLLPMDLPALDLSEFAMGRAPHLAQDLYVYGPRDIYRPGETVVLDGVLRNHDGGPTRGMPVKARVIRPDGRTVREFTWRPGPQAHYHTRFHLPQDAITGKWRVTFDMGTGKLTPYPFVVAEFLPERMKLAFSPDSGEGLSRILDRDTGLALRLQGDFLYGAPAAGSRANALIHIKPARELFKEKWPGYQFGDVKNLVNQTFTTEDIRLDSAGAGVIPVENQWQKVTSPHWVTANASLYDSGGRPVVRNRSWQVWPARELVGIRNLSAMDKDDPGRVENDSLAGFEVILADRSGRRLPAQGLKVTMIREHREYYWEFKNGEWHWGSFSQFYSVNRFTLDIPENGTGRVDIPVQWGGYRLEILNPATGLTSAFGIWAGWRPESKGSGVMNRPDRVDLTLDKEAYRPGDTVRVFVRSPEGGKGFLFVESDTNELTLPIDLPAKGQEIEIPMNPAWNRHDLYISALVVRPGESRTGHLPKRAIGRVHLPLDRKDRQLSVKIQAPAKTEPDQALPVQVHVARADGRAAQNAWVTLAAVDVGILNLTQFNTPDPFGYFFQARQYGVQLHDLYQKLIEANSGAWARQRFGGDAPTLSRGGNRPATDVRIVAIHHQAVETDSQGNASFSLKIPEFDGSLRLMAVAHTENRFGSADHEMVVAAPLVVQAVMPRFLATGDKSQVALDIHNMTQAPQSLTVLARIKGPAAFEGSPEHQVMLAPSAKTTLILPIRADKAPGRARIRCLIKGLKTDGKEREMERQWFIETRSPYPPLTRRWKARIKPAEGFSIKAGELENLVSSTVAVQAVLGSEPPVNLADHISRLEAYPYGCLEQTVSGLFPHVLLSAQAFSDLGLKTDAPDQKAAKVRTGIQRLMEKQKSSGGFGLWSAKSRESAWLTAYTTHFLSLAGEAGYEVPETAGKKAVERLLVYVRQPGAIPYEGYVNARAYRSAVRSYAAFVLARRGALSLGDARAVFRYVQQHGKSLLGFVQAGCALGLAGDRHTAAQAFDRAIKTQRSHQIYIGDYGSDLRDFAAAYYLVAGYFPEYPHRALFLHELAAALDRREWLSTQERNSLVMAGAARLNADGVPWHAGLAVNGRSTELSGTAARQALFTRGVASQGFEVKNMGEHDLYLDLVLAGYPAAKPAPEARGAEVGRRYLDTDGRPVDAARIQPGDRLVVELRIKAEKRMPHCLVVDMLPAGLELEDPNVSGAFLINEILVDKKTVDQWQSEVGVAHTEYRDDRFVAALDVRSGQSARIFYAVRAVSPGHFQVPPPLVEDMYRPYIRGIGPGLDRMDVTGIDAASD